MRTKLFLVSALAPPLVAALLLGVGSSLLSLSTPSVLELSGAIVYAYIFGIIPSVAYAGVMDYVYRRLFTPSQPQALLLSAAIGLVCGLLIIGLTIRDTSQFRPFAVFGILGFATGAVVTLINSRIYNSETQKK